MPTAENNPARTRSIASVPAKPPNNPTAIAWTNALRVLPFCTHVPRPESSFMTVLLYDVAHDCKDTTSTALARLCPFAGSETPFSQYFCTPDGFLDINTRTGTFTSRSDFIPVHWKIVLRLGKPSMANASTCRHVPSRMRNEDDFRPVPNKSTRRRRKRTCQRTSVATFQTKSVESMGMPPLRLPPSCPFLKSEKDSRARLETKMPASAFCARRHSSPYDYAFRVSVYHERTGRQYPARKTKQTSLVARLSLSSI